MGVVGLETSFAASYTHLVKKRILPLEKLVELMHTSPMRRFGCGTEIAVGQPADLTVFDLNRTYTVDPETFLTMGRATPLRRHVPHRCVQADNDRRRDRLEGGHALIEVTYTIAENALIASGVYRLKLEGDTSAITAPGQFLDLRLPGFFLRRPISICDWDEKSVTLLYKVVGGGTDWLSRCTPGQALDALRVSATALALPPAVKRRSLRAAASVPRRSSGLSKRLLAAGKTPVAVLGFNTAGGCFLRK